MYNNYIDIIKGNLQKSQYQFWPKLISRANVT